MLNLMNWNQPLEVNGVTYQNSAEAYNQLKDFKGKLTINLKPSTVKQEARPVIQDTNKTYRIHVKKYMTEKASPSFDFMKKWNNDIPMPFVVMYGEILEETKGMYKMKLHGRVESKSTNCMHCGRTLTNVVSRNYGIGPICGGHMNIAPPATVEEFIAREKEIIDKIQAVKWEGWVIKSAIKEMKEVDKKKEVKTA